MTNSLPTTTLGRTQIEVTKLGFGALELRDPTIKWPIENELAETLLNSVLDSGINFIDTADCYGRSEQFIGEFISHRRSEFTLATKCGCVPGGREWTKENLVAGIDRSLKRLKTDHVDVWQLHGATMAQVDQCELIEVMNTVRDQGKVRWIGASTSSPHLASFIQAGVLDVFQIPYSGISRMNERWISKAAEAGMGTIIRGGVAGGEPGIGKGTVEKWSLWETACLDDLLDEGESRTTFMLRLTLSHKDVNTIIVGSKNPLHILGNTLAAQRGALPPATYDEAILRITQAGETPEPVD